MRYPTPRKTVDVIHLVTSLNRAILEAYNRGMASDGIAAVNGELKALCFAIETVLHNSGNYSGYGYLLPNYSTYDVIEQEKFNYARCYYLSETMRAAYREAYQWCANCKDYHVKDGDKPGRCSWCGGMNID